MVKADLVNRVMVAANLSKPAARRAVDEALGEITGALLLGRRIVIRRFGVFFVAPKKTGIARNPRTGAPAKIPPGRVVKFRPGQDLRSLPNASS